MSKDGREYHRAVADLERCLIHLARAAGRMAYVNNYLERHGARTGGLWDAIAQCQCDVETMMEDETLKDARKAKPRRRR